ncbi:Tetratricopeptide repeat domain protein [Hyalangium minutum]|uniref:Tetratricopeptide repeat domain protein n=1 Tax=Hyalangium minutum TaxID=394096 RepID=A0A085WCA9_9BACT|nr:Tetratricopeptide repeat domain protein [Hyalangium minutum]
MSMALLVAMPSGAWAQKGAKNPAALVKEGERLYNAGKYREAAEVLKKAQEAQPNSKLIYNIARAYEQAGDLRESLSYYQQYVGQNTEEADPTLLKRSALAIDRLRVLIDKEAKAAAEAEVERKRLQEQADASRRKAEEEQAAARRAEEVSRQQQKAEQERALADYRRSRVIAFSLGGLSAVSLGGGLFFGLQARDARTKFDDATNLDGKQTAADTTRSKALLADIGMGVGLAAAIGAIIVFPKEGPPAEGEVRLTLAPRGTGAGVEVSF